MSQYKPTVYEQIVQDFLAGKELKFEDYQEELAARGWEDKRYFDAYVEDMKYIKSLMDGPNFNLREAADLVKKNHPSKNEDVLRFSLTEEEKEIALEAEELGSFKDGEVVRYEGYDKEIVCADYLNLPENVDAFVVFSGHAGSATPAIEAWYRDFKKAQEENRPPKKLVFLGLYDNQGNTDFSQDGLKYNTGSEVEMYVKYCRDLGVPEEVLQECLVTPNDTSTDDNIDLLAEIRNKYFDGEEATFAMFGYPAYQKRIASEFSFKLQKMEENGDVKPINIVMPVVPIKKDERDRYLPYDDFDSVAQDIILGNCLAHPYRFSKGGRFDSKLGEYPDKFKPLLPISLVYSYPNVANELAGTDMEVATMLKLLRAIQHDAYKMEDAHVVDRKIQRHLFDTAKDLVLKGLVSAKSILKRTHVKNSLERIRDNHKGAKQALKRIRDHQKKANADLNAEEAASIVLGAEDVHPRKKQAVVDFIKKLTQQKEQK